MARIFIVTCPRQKLRVIVIVSENAKNEGPTVAPFFAILSS